MPAAPTSCARPLAFRSSARMWPTASCSTTSKSRARAYGIPARPVTPDTWLEEGDTVTVAGHTFDVFHCPGHSPGSVVMVNRAQRFALMGDVLFRGSIGRTDFPYGDHDALIDAIKTKLFPLGDDIAFICGHGPTSTIGAERRSNPFVT